MNIFIIEVRMLITMFVNLDLGSLSRRQVRIKARNRKEAIERTRKRLTTIYTKKIRKISPYFFDEHHVAVHFKLKTESGKVVAKGSIGLPSGRLNLFKLVA